MASVTRRSTAARTDRRAAIRARLVSATVELMGTGVSFTEVSVERLVARAGMARSTFYVYFPDKGALLLEAVEEVFAELAVATRGWYGLSPDASRDDLRAALAHVVATYRPHTALMSAVIDAAEYDPVLREAVGAHMDRQVAGLRRHIEHGQRSGAVDPDLPAEIVAGWLTWMSERGLHKLAHADGEKLVEGYTAVLWNTLYRPAR